MSDVVSINTNSLIQGVYLSTTDDIISILSEIGEVGIDSVLDEGILKNIPIFSVLRTIYKIGYNVRDAHLFNQFRYFIIAMERGCSTPKEKEHYRQLFLHDQKARDQELTYITVLLDRFIEYNKSEMLAACYL